MPPFPPARSLSARRAPVEGDATGLIGLVAGALQASRDGPAPTRSGPEQAAGIEPMAREATKAGDLLAKRRLEMAEQLRAAYARRFEPPS